MLLNVGRKEEKDRAAGGPSPVLPMAPGYRPGPSGLSYEYPFDRRSACCLNCVCPWWYPDWRGNEGCRQRYEERETEKPVRVHPGQGEQLPMPRPLGKMLVPSPWSGPDLTPLKSSPPGGPWLGCAPAQTCDLAHLKTWERSPAIVPASPHTCKLPLLSTKHYPKIVFSNIWIISVLSQIDILN